MNVRKVIGDVYIQVCTPEYERAEAPSGLEGPLDQLDLSKAFTTLQTVSQQMIEKIAPEAWIRKPDSIELKLGLSFTKSGSVVILSGEVGATFECTVHWDLASPAGK